MAFVQKTAEEWIKTGRPRTAAGKIPREEALLEELRATNAQESIDLATAFLGEKFLNTQVSERVSAVPFAVLTRGQVVPAPAHVSIHLPHVFIHAKYHRTRKFALCIHNIILCAYSICINV